MALNLHGSPGTQAELDAGTIASLRHRVHVLEKAQERIPYLAEQHRQEVMRIEQRAHRAERELQELTNGRDWAWAASEVRDIVLKQLEDPTMNRSRMRRELAEIVRLVEERGFR